MGASSPMRMSNTPHRYAIAAVSAVHWHTMAGVRWNRRSDSEMDYYSDSPGDTFDWGSIVPILRLARQGTYLSGSTGQSFVASELRWSFAWASQLESLASICACSRRFRWPNSTFAYFCVPIWTRTCDRPYSHVASIQTGCTMATGSNQATCPLQVPCNRRDSTRSARTSACATHVNHRSLACTATRRMWPKRSAVVWSLAISTISWDSMLHLSCSIAHFCKRVPDAPDFVRPARAWCASRRWMGFHRFD